MRPRREHTTSRYLIQTAAAGGGNPVRDSGMPSTAESPVIGTAAPSRRAGEDVPPAHASLTVLGGTTVRLTRPAASCGRNGRDIPPSADAAATRTASLTPPVHPIREDPMHRTLAQSALLTFTCGLRG
jgi:hypothetical protein